MEIKKLKVCLLGASFGTSNMGVNALAAGTITAFYQQFPEGELFLLDYGKDSVTYNLQISNRIIPVQLINIRFSKKFYLKNNIALLIVLAIIIRCMPFSSIRNKLIHNNLWLGRIADADIVASMAGGDSFSDIYGLGRLLYVSLPQLLALILGKRLLVLPQTIGPFKGVFAKLIAKNILRRAEVIYSRDHAGVGDTRDLVGLDTAQKVRFCYDVGFVLDPVKPKNIELQLDNSGMKERPIVGLNISGLLYMGGYSRNNMFGLKIYYKEFMSELIGFMIEKKNTTVILIPHVLSIQGEGDTVACQEVYSFLKERYGGRLLIASGEYNQSEIKYIIGRCDFFIGSRMHACIAALSQNIPTVSIAYSSKFIGVMQTIGVADLIADPRKLKKEEILKVISDVFDHKAQLRKHLENTMPLVKKTVLNLFNEINTNAISNDT